MTRRQYHSPLREEQAAHTRDRVVDAARYLFTERGFEAATVAMIAERAGVSEPTIYNTFGSKSELLLALLRRLELDAGVDTWRERIAAEHDPRRRIALFAEWSAELFAGGRDVLLVARDARAIAEVAEFWEQGEANRRVAVERVVGGVADAGALRDGLDAEKAADRAWILSGPETYLLATDGAGWNDTDYVVWLTETLTRQLMID